MLKTLSIAFIIIILAACSEKPGGVFVMNEETIENFFEKDKQSWNPPEHLNLLLDQPITQASIPPLPPGLTRLYGVLSSNGAYAFKNGNNAIVDRGSSFKSGEYGMLGPAGKGGNAWFYADFNRQTGEIVDARAYLYGFMGGVCDMREKTRASYGKIGDESFYLNINGPCLFPQISGSTANYALFVQGSGNLLNAPAQKVFPIEYIVDDTGTILTIPANPSSQGDIYDAGHGRAWLGQ